MVTLHRRAATALLLSGLFVVGTASADHINGIRVTVTNIDPGSLSVEVDVTALTGSPTATAGQVHEFPAFEWGEGETITSEERFLNGAGSEAGLAVYRRSFSHSYSSAGSFTIRARSTGAGGAFPELVEEGYTGNPRTGGGEVPTVGGYVTYFTNTALVEFQQSVLEIPTASTVGLGLLSLALAGAGFWLIRR